MTEPEEGDLRNDFLPANQREKNEKLISSYLYLCPCLCLLLSNLLLLSLTFFPAKRNDVVEEKRPSEALRNKETDKTQGRILSDHNPHSP